MTLDQPGVRTREAAPVRPPRVALFGLLGSGNLGNEGSLEALLAGLRDRRPDVDITCVCPSPDEVTRRFGLPARPMHWYDRFATRSLPAAFDLLLKVVGKVADVPWTLRWVLAVDVVVVPGMGVLEATLPFRPWGWPLALLLAALAARVTRTPFAFVCAGVEYPPPRVTRWMLTAAARLARYRSYRDELSRDEMRRLGVDTTGEDVFPDVAFVLPTPVAAREPGTIGVGVMAFHGTAVDRPQASAIHARYLDGIRAFVRRMVDEGRRIRLCTGDPVDLTVVDAILADLRTHRPGLAPGTVTVAETATLGELARALSATDVVVASRYHNVLAALKSGVPTISLSYATKGDVLMAAMGQAGACQPIRSFDVDRLVEQVHELERDRERIAARLRDRAAANAERLGRQFEALDDLLPATSRIA